MRQVKAISASKNDGIAYTYRTSQFKDLVFTSGDSYMFQYDNGELVAMKASRNGTTLYSGKVKHNQPIPEIGKPVTHNVINVYKQLKTALK